MPTNRFSISPVTTGLPMKIPGSSTRRIKTLPSDRDPRYLKRYPDLNRFRLKRWEEKQTNKTEEYVQEIIDFTFMHGCRLRTVILSESDRGSDPICEPDDRHPGDGACLSRRHCPLRDGAAQSGYRHHSLCRRGEIYRHCLSLLCRLSIQ